MIILSHNVHSVKQYKPIVWDKIRLLTRSNACKTGTAIEALESFIALARQLLPFRSLYLEPLFLL